MHDAVMEEFGGLYIDESVEAEPSREVDLGNPAGTLENDIELQGCQSRPHGVEVTEA